VLRLGWGDTQNVNRAFVFQGRDLVTVQPLSEYLIENLSSDRIRLVRNMSTQEAQLWQMRDLENLKANGKDWNYGTRVTHLQLETRSWIADGLPGFEFHIPKPVLLQLARRGLIRVGATSVNQADPQIFTFEVVVLENAWSVFQHYYSGPTQQTPLTL